MEKAQNYAAGGQIARTMYQEFLTRPKWLRGLSKADRQIAIDMLQDLVLTETKAALKASEGKCEVTTVSHHTHRARVAHKLECFLRYGSSAELAMYGYDN